MQSMPLLLRQSLRSPGLSTFSRTGTTTTTTARPVRINPSATPKALLLHASRDFSVCRRCQFRSQNRLYSSQSQSQENNNVKDGKMDAAGETPTAAAKDQDPVIALPQEGDAPKPEDTQQDASTSGLNTNTENIQAQDLAGAKTGGGLPSYLENRRSRYSKQFSSMMDNLQSNVFVAGQRLNDLTGYSSIEALKNDIHVQEERLRAARRHVRETKDNYASAINRRSTSQREVNELLQRKHAWSSADLERFTHLYRNDHTNEVSEHETQEALTMAEREAEEATTQLSKSILSRYHEEQVWSDKIRRMSTWGTWGLMGVNVLLFLIFQIGVEPWRRHRLVKGFEEKVIEALEKDKTLAPQGPTTAAAATQTEAPAASPSSTTTTTTTTQEQKQDQDQDPLQSSTTETPDLPAAQVSTTSSTTTTNTDENILEYGKSQLSRISPPSTSVESWRRTFHELFSDHILSITQRDLTSVVIQSAAAGAAVMGLVIAIIRPR